MRSTLQNKLNSRRGESLAEVLVAMLVIALAVLLLASMVSAAGSIDMRIRARDEHFYAELSAAETDDFYKESAAAVAPDARAYQITVQVEKQNAAGGWEDDGAPKTVDVELYGGDHLLSYKPKTS